MPKNASFGCVRDARRTPCLSLKQASMFSASAPPLMTGPLARPLGAACERWCRMVARHPWPFLLAPVLTTVLLGSGALWRFRVVR